MFAGMSYKELDERLENDPNIIICWKWCHIEYGFVDCGSRAWRQTVGPQPETHDQMC